VKKKLKLEISNSLQRDLAANYTVWCIDTPGAGSSKIIPKNMKEYVAELRKITPRADIVIGHSIGARVALLYAAETNARSILLDPTPDYILETAPQAAEKMTSTSTGEFMRAVVASLDILRAQNLKDTPTIYSIDDTDKNSVEKEKYFVDFIHAVKLINATHWVHVSHPEEVLKLVHAII